MALPLVPDISPTSTFTNDMTNNIKNKFRNLFSNGYLTDENYVVVAVVYLFIWVAIKIVQVIVLG